LRALKELTTAPQEFPQFLQFPRFLGIVARFGSPLIAQRKRLPQRLNHIALGDEFVADV